MNSFLEKIKKMEHVKMDKHLSTDDVKYIRFEIESIDYLCQINYNHQQWEFTYLSHWFGRGCCSLCDRTIQMGMTTCLAVERNAVLSKEMCDTLVMHPAIRLNLLFKQ